MPEEHIEPPGRALLPGTLTPEELKLGEEICEHISSSEYLNLHSDAPAIGAQQGLTISAGVFVHAVVTNIMGNTVQASILVKDEGI